MNVEAIVTAAKGISDTDWGFQGDDRKAEIQRRLGLASVSEAIERAISTALGGSAQPGAITE
jgi:hypothetical protein